MMAPEVINLTRLLQHAEALLDGHDSATLSQAQQGKLVAFVARMDALLSAIDHGALCPEAQRQSLRRGVLRFRSLLDPAAASSITLALNDSALSATQRARHVGAKARMIAATREDQVTQLLSPPPKAKARWDDVAQQTAALLEHHAARQDELLRDMEADSSVMRDAALAIGDTINADRSRFETLAAVGEQNAAALGEAKVCCVVFEVLMRSSHTVCQGRIRSQIGRTCGVTWLAMAVLVLTMIFFVWTVLMMRVLRK